MVLGFAWTNFLSGLTGALLGVVATFGGAAMAQRGERQREAARDARALRDGKLVRLRQAYITLITAARAAESMGEEMGYEPQDESGEEQAARLKVLFDKALATLWEARVRLALEPEAAAVLEISGHLWERDFTTYRELVWRRRRSPSPQLAAEEDSAFEAMRTAIQRMEALAREQLSALEQPIPLNHQAS